MAAPLFCCALPVSFSWEEPNHFSILRAYDLTGPILPKMVCSSHQSSPLMIEVVRKEDEAPEWNRYFCYQQNSLKNVCEVDYTDFKHGRFTRIIGWEEYQCAEHCCRYQIRLYKKSILYLGIIGARLIEDPNFWRYWSHEPCDKIGSESTLIPELPCLMSQVNVN